MPGTLLQPALLLAQEKPRFSSEVLIWLGIILVLAFTLGIFAMWLRRRLLTENEPTVPLGFTLKDLRELHALGQISDEELALAEAKALAKSRSLYLGDGENGPEEPEDIGHLSTEGSDDEAGGTENPNGSSDKNLGDGPSS